MVDAVDLANQQGTDNGQFTATKVNFGKDPANLLRGVCYDFACLLARTGQCLP